jgi:hypothetical protein
MHEICMHQAIWLDYLPKAVYQKNQSRGRLLDRAVPSPPNSFFSLSHHRLMSPSSSPTPPWPPVLSDFASTWTPHPGVIFLQAVPQMDEGISHIS